ncbi:MAG: hypothetical protein QM311_00945 [Acidobacteriota bacterium]|nr:hypothetical protein [Acidobacteriota bacterium]
MCQPFNPLDPAEYPGLQRRSRRDAELEGLDPSVGEDALQDVLLRVGNGALRLDRQHPRRYFRVCVLNRIRDIARRERRSGSIDVFIQPTTDPERKSRRLLILGLLREAPEVEKEDLEETLRLRLGAALKELGPDQNRAVRAQIRGWLENEGGRESVRAFEEYWGIDLGSYAGTAGLAVALQQKPATVASWAHRGMKAVAHRLAQGEAECIRPGSRSSSP